MEHGKRRGIYRNFDAERFDLGNEAPLSVDGETRGAIDRRRVSVQWFSGTILTGLCGAALMGGAVFAALDGQTNFATVPERVEVALRGAVGNLADHIASLRKGNRLPPAGETNTHRQVIRVSTTTHVGNRELVRVRPFVHVAGNLAMSVTEVSAGIPPFNPQKMLAEAESPDAAAAADDPGAEPDAEVSFVMRDLAPMLPKAKLAAALAMDEVVMGVRDAAVRVGSTGSLPGGDAQPSVRMAYAAEGGGPNPYTGFETRIAPENITLLPKTTAQTTGGNPWSERTVTLKKGDSVASVLRDLGARPDDIKDVTTALGARGRDGGLKEGQKLRILVDPSDPKRPRPLRVVVASDSGVDAIVALSDLGKYVSIDPQAADTEVAQTADTDVDDGTGVRLYQSIYETALRNQVPRPVIEDLIRIYSYDVDFQHKVQPGELDGAVVLRRGREQQREGRGPLCLAHHRRREQEILPLSIDRRQHRRLLRRDRQERQKIPGAQAGVRGDHDLPVRRPQSSVAAPGQDRIPGSTGGRRSERRSSPPATARSRPSAWKAATASTSRSAMPTAMRPPTATCRLLPATCRKAAMSARAR